MIAYEMAHAAPGTLYAEIARRVMNDLYPLDPEYARGILTSGALVKYPGGMELDAVAMEADRPGTSLRWLGNGRSGAFEFSLNGTWNATLEVFDVPGRRVATVDSGMRSGTQKIAWNPDRLASGLYFGRLEVRRGKESHHWSTKVLLLR